jgi:hypothetical protein
MDPDSISVDAVGELRLVQLRAALEARGLLSSGSKAELVERLRRALLEDGGGTTGDVAGGPAKRRRLEETELADDAAIRARQPTAVTANVGEAQEDDDDVGPRVPAGLVAVGGHAGARCM